ncbi:MAG: superoxide dismutase family protein [Gammaproteobacteria bacterium]|nr:superoxide dismutase family protein [Gammaproteobacteria bacterium]
MKKIGKALAAIMLGIGMSVAHASLIIPVYLTTPDGEGHKIGTIRADDTIYGLIMTPKLHDLPPGVHGFHIHAEPMCDHDGKAAGGHLDPDKTNVHRGPYENGHLGDMPVLNVDANGDATQAVLAPRLKLAFIMGKAVMIHAGGDNYSDKPEKLGGGGARIACGIIPYH